MAIGRSLTKKGSRYMGFSSSSSEESHSKRNSVSKTQISAPVALISTTNMISYTSPSLSLRTSQSASSMSSSASSSPTSTKFPSSPFSSGSGSDTEATDPPSPEPAMSPPPNHLSTYFSTNSAPKPPSPLRSLSSRSVMSSGSMKKTPPIPIARSNSRTTAWPGQHTKALHSLTRSGSVHHPFGNELAKVAEMTEEFSSSKKDADELFMVEHGLQKFSAKDYESEIWGELGGVFEDVLPKLTAGWI